MVIFLIIVEDLKIQSHERKKCQMKMCIQKLIDEFDFDKVHEHMKLNNLIWHFSHVPNVDELKQCAIKLLQMTIEEDEQYQDTTISSGGFTVIKHNNYLELLYALENTCFHGDVSK